MGALTGEITEQVTLDGLIAEMGAFDTSTRPDLRIPADFLETVRASDSDPMFVTVEVEAGWSESKRRWKPEHLKSVVDKVNKSRMAGNLGHPLLDPKAHERDFPIPQACWVVGKLEGNKATFKGYVLKTAEARDLLKLGLIDGISIFGDSTMKPVQGGYEVIRFDPETIDFARKGRSGMKSRIVSLTGEQTPERGTTVEAKDIAALSVDEIRTHAPLLVREIERQASVPFETKIGEQTTAIDALQPEADMLAEIKKLLKLTDGENPVEKLTNLITRIEEAGSADIRAYVKELVAKKVKSTRGQALLGRLIGEMHTEYEGPLDDDLKKKITDDFNAKIEGDEDIKELVGEMASSSSDDDNREGPRALGGRSRAGAHRGTFGEGGNSTGTDGVVKTNERITVRKKTFV
jgi:hypothetical protein